MSDVETKPIWASKTFIGAVVSVVASVAMMTGHSIGDTGMLTEQIAVILGAVLSIYGRMAADKKVTL